MACWIKRICRDVVIMSFFKMDLRLDLLRWFS